MVRMGKQRLPILDNLAYCRILYSLNSEILRAQDIANKVGIDQSVIIRQLKHLTSKEEGFVKVTKVKKSKYYSVNWVRVNEEFISFIEQEVKRKYKQLHSIYKDKTESYLITNSLYANSLSGNMVINGRKIRVFSEKDAYSIILGNDPLKKRIIENVYLIDLFQKIFRSFEKYSYYDKTLSTTFSDLANSFEIPWHTPFVKRKLEEYNDQDFIDLNKLSSILITCFRRSDIEYRAVSEIGNNSKPE